MSSTKEIAAPELFFGHEYDAYTCDELAVANIDRKLLRHKEAALYCTKWYDYRFMHPTKASFWYADAYIRAYKRTFSSHISADGAKHAKGLKSPNIFKLNKCELSGIWKGRQMADELGIPYQFYTSVIFNWTTRQGWKRLPRPSQLYSDDAAFVALSAWKRHQESKIVVPIIEDYLTKNFYEHPYQIEFQNWLCERIKERPNPEFALGHYLHKQPMLTRKIASAHFNESTIHRAAILILE